MTNVYVDFHCFTPLNLQNVANSHFQYFLKRFILYSNLISRFNSNISTHIYFTFHQPSLCNLTPNCTFFTTLLYQYLQSNHEYKCLMVHISFQIHLQKHFVYVISNLFTIEYLLYNSFAFNILILIKEIECIIFNFTQLNSKKSFHQCGATDSSKSSSDSNKTNSDQNNTQNNQQPQPLNLNNSTNQSTDDGDNEDSKKSQQNNQNDETEQNEIKQKSKKSKSSVALFQSQNYQSNDNENRDEQLYIDDLYLNSNKTKSSIAMFDSSQSKKEKIEFKLDSDNDSLKLETNLINDQFQSEFNQNLNLNQFQITNEDSIHLNDFKDQNHLKDCQIQNELKDLINDLEVDEVKNDNQGIKCFEEQIFTIDCLKISDVLSNSLESLTFKREMAKQQFKKFVDDETMKCIDKMNDIENNSKKYQKLTLKNAIGGHKLNLKEFKKKEEYIFDRLKKIDNSISENSEKISSIKKSLHIEIAKWKNIMKAKLEELRQLL